MRVALAPTVTATGDPSVVPPEGVLFYVIGAPAESKQRLLREARRELAANHRVIFAHRYVTRAHGMARDDEVELPEAEFLARVRYRLFSMHWECRGVRYGIGKEINYWLALGLSVVVKGSRTGLAPALEAYPEMTVLCIGDGAGPGGHGSRARDFQPCSQDARGHRARRGARVFHLDCNGTLPGARDVLVSVLTGGSTGA
jgi:hypothetical protein